MAPICDLICTRCRMVCEIPSSTRARLPPTEDWIAIAVTMRSRSSLPTRRTMFASAAGVEVPSLVSRMTLVSSSAIGGEPDWATDSMA